MNKLTSMQQQVLDGAMLGDGSLIIHKNGVNAYLSYLSKSRQHVEFVMNYFKEFLTDAGYVDSSYYDKRTDKIYYHTRARTKAEEIFTEQFERWYPDKKKHIPLDIKLTPLVCLIWYIGDGGLIKANKTQTIKLSTQCFNKEEQEKYLLPQLIQFEAKIMKADIGKNGERQYYIYIPHRKIKDFLNYIGGCPFSDYSYKWKYQEYKNFCIAHNPNFIDEIIDLFFQGFSAGTIAKYEEVDRSTVVKYLKQNNIDPTTNKYSKLRLKDIKINKKEGIYNE